MEHAVELPASLNLPPAKPALLEYYTHPHCAQCGAFEPHWQQLRAEFGHRFAWRNRLGGGRWPAHPNALRPTGSAQVAPAGQPDRTTNVPLASLAVKCAERQGAQAGELFLRAVRAATGCPGRSAASWEELAAVAAGLAAQVPAVFDAAVFCRDIAANAGATALADDLAQAHRHAISTYPALVVVRGPERDPGLSPIVGYRPYEALLHALSHMAPDLFYVPSLVDGGAG